MGHGGFRGMYAAPVAGLLPGSVYRLPGWKSLERTPHTVLVFARVTSNQEVSMRNQAVINPATGAVLGQYIWVDVRAITR